MRTRNILRAGVAALALSFMVGTSVPAHAQSCSAGYTLITGAYLTSGSYPALFSTTAVGMSSYVGTSTVSVNVYSASSVFIGTATVTTPLVLIAPATIRLNQSTRKTTTVVWCSLNPPTATPVPVLVTVTPIPPTSIPAPSMADVVEVGRQQYALTLMFGTMAVGVLALMFTRRR